MDAKYRIKLYSSEIMDSMINYTNAIDDSDFYLIDNTIDNNLSVSINKLKIEKEDMEMYIKVLENKIYINKSNQNLLDKYIHNHNEYLNLLKFQEEYNVFEINGYDNLIISTNNLISNYQNKKLEYINEEKILLEQYECETEQMCSSQLKYQEILQQEETIADFCRKITSEIETNVHCLQNIVQSAKSVNFYELQNIIETITVWKNSISLSQKRIDSEITELQEFVKNNL